MKMKKTIIAVFVACTVMSTVSTAQDFSRFTFEGGGGLSFPMGSAKNRLNAGYNFLLGGGVKFTPAFSGLLEFQYDHFSLTNQVLQAFEQPAGFNRFWSFTLNPRYYINPKGKVSGYATAGYGIYSRSLAFTDPSQAVGYCDPYYGDCYSSGAPVIAEFTNYSGGFNVGGGLTYALGESGFKFVTDLRYNRLLSHANNEFVTLSFGIVF
jgi:hypothetical protein